MKPNRYSGENVIERFFKKEKLENRDYLKESFGQKGKKKKKRKRR